MRVRFLVRSGPIKTSRKIFKFFSKKIPAAKKTVNFILNGMEFREKVIEKIGKL